MQCSFPSSPLPIHFLGALPRSGPLVLASQSSSGVGLPWPGGPDETAGRDAADPALSYTTFRLPGLLVVAAPVLVRFKLPLCRWLCVSASIQLHSPVLYLLGAVMCHYLVTPILHLTYQLSLKTVIWSLTTLNIMIIGSFIFFYFKGWCWGAQRAAVSISAFAKASECALPITVLTLIKAYYCDRYLAFI